MRFNREEAEAMNHSHDNDRTYEWVCDRPTVPAVIGRRAHSAGTEHDPGTVALRRGMRTRPVRITFDHSAKR